MRSALLRGRTVAVAVPALALLATVTPSAMADEAPAGSAYGASAAISLLPGVLGGKGIAVETGKLAASSTSGKHSADVVDVPLKGVITAKAITSSAEQDGPHGPVTAKAAIVDATIPLLAGLAGSTPKTGVISSECKSTPQGVTGTSKLVGLDLGKIGNLELGTPPNQKIGVPEVLQVIVNEQIKHPDGSLTVNALHLKLLGGQVTGALGSGDIVLASSTCAKVTGGGEPTEPTKPTKPSEPTKPSQPTRPGQPSQPGHPGGGNTNTQPPAGGPAQVSVVPAGAPETGDGSEAAGNAR
ncbi:hypothetical protein ATK36_1640 [Amycolatopsis sulphurea]|uniref:Uncharacterized protein n=1 Tax=Amycolatopsis sulphurea TaxID=76022 RepID=A0A2A9F8B0_9PSEU|nr:choice-of-anchor P family protein [Amycolatopsis sulphurea]PFG46649.1 hypothetical protein ATK36_1640 [Amycolatopsis sulphurea]